MTKIGKILLETFGAIVLGLIVLMLVLAWRLSEGPISLSFAENIFANYYQTKHKQFQIGLDEPALKWDDRNRSLSITFEDLLFSTNDGNIILNAPAGRIGISLSSLLKGDITTAGLNLGSANIQVKHLKNNDLLDKIFSSLSRTTPTPENLIQSTTALILSSLSKINIENSSLTIIKRETAAPIIVKGLKGIFSKKEGWIATVEGIAPPDIGNSIFVIKAELDTKTLDLKADARLHDIPIKIVSRHIPSFPKEASLGAPLDLKYNIKINLVTKVKTINGEIEVANGELSIPEFSYNRIPFRRIYASAKIDDFFSIPTFGTLSIESDNFSVSSNFLFDKETRQQRFSWNIYSEEIEAKKLKQYLSLAGLSGSNLEFVSGIQSGFLNDISMEITSTSDLDDFRITNFEAVSGKAKFRNVKYKTQYLRHLLSGLFGEISIGKEQILVNAYDGKYQNLSLTNSSIKVDLNNSKPTFKLKGYGDLESIITFMREEPLGLEKNISSIPENISANANFEVNLEPQLPQQREAAGYTYSAKVQLTDVIISNFLLKEDLSDGKITLSIAPEKTEISGIGMYNGAPVSFSQIKPLSANPSLTYKQRLSLISSGKKLSTLHSSVPFNATGPIPLELKTIKSSQGVSKVSGILNLQNAKLSIPRLNWTKPSGAAGRIKFNALLENNVLKNLTNFNLASADLSLDMDMSFLPGKNKISSATIHNFQIGLNKMHGSVKLGENGIYHAKFFGPHLNINQIMSDTLHSNELQEPYFIEANFDDVFLWDLPPIKKTALTIKNFGQYKSNMKLIGNVGNKPLNITSWLKDEIREFRLSARDAGQVLKGFEITDSISDGLLKIDGKITGTGLKEVTKTNILIENFGVKDAPLFTQILNATSLVGLVNTLRGKGIRFQTLRADVDFTPNKIEIKDSFASGTSLGFSTEGAIDRNSDQISIKGMIVPAYILNRIIDQIPVVGRILTGGRKEGLLAAEYLISGTRDEPEVSVNPLTAFTPGFLRAFVKATRKPLE